MAKRIHAHSELIDVLERTQIEDASLRQENTRLRQENTRLRRENAVHVADVAANFEHAEELVENVKQLSAFLKRHL